MARLTDHDIRDAEHALRMEVALILGRYSRRLIEAGKAEIQTQIEAAAKDERAIDGSAIGRSAAATAASSYFGGLAGAAPQPAIESRTDSPAETFAGAGLGPRG